MIATPRLYLREFREEDAPFLYALNADPEVLRYTGDPPFQNVDHALRFIKEYDHYRLYGHGRYAVLDLDNGEFLGWCGLKWNTGISEADLGYRFFKHTWGNGYATEAGKACLEEGYRRFGYPSVIGRVMIPNTPSSRVLLRLGFRFERYAYCSGMISEQWRHVPPY